ncbi:hypothetical protein L7F22_047992 [Adiantum nelumboides]|nr:hypothetical protein [Adiantum nelumboides]
MLGRGPRAVLAAVLADAMNCVSVAVVSLRCLRVEEELSSTGSLSLPLSAILSLNKEKKPVSKERDRTLSHLRHLCTVSGYHNRTIFSVDWSKNMGFIATAAGDDCIRIFSEDSNDKTTLDSGSPTYKMLLRKEKAHSTDVNCVRWHPQESSLLASAGDDSTVKVWRVNYKNL